ncbi:MAG: MBL fold metallo-hydrolase [Anaerolineales bacterium]
MEIFWYGSACFRLSERGFATVVTEPGTAAHPKADVFTFSHPTSGRFDAVRCIEGPGEYEVGGVFITGVRTNGAKRSEGEPKNTVYVFNYNGVTVAHLGDLRHVPTQAEMEALGEVNVALVPVGGALSAADAAEVVHLLDPAFVLPMYEHAAESRSDLAPLTKFLKEMGVNEAEVLPMLKVTRATLPEEMQVIVLDVQH